MPVRENMSDLDEAVKRVENELRLVYSMNGSDQLYADLSLILAALAETQRERGELIKALRQLRFQLNLSQGMRADQARIHANAAVDQGLAQALTARHDSEA